MDTIPSRSNSGARKSLLTFNTAKHDKRSNLNEDSDYLNGTVGFDKTFFETLKKSAQFTPKISQHNKKYSMDYQE